jgi:hypothetical protein
MSLAPSGIEIMASKQYYVKTEKSRFTRIKSDNIG